MNEAEIRKYAMLMQELGLTGLEVKENVGVVRLERAGAGPVRGVLHRVPRCGGLDGAGLPVAREHATASAPMG